MLLVEPVWAVQVPLTLPRLYRCLTCWVLAHPEQAEGSLTASAPDLQVLQAGCPQTWQHVLWAHSEASAACLQARKPWAGPCFQETGEASCPQSFHPWVALCS